MRRRFLTGLILVSLCRLHAVSGVPDETKTDSEPGVSKTTAVGKETSVPDMETIRKELEGLSREERAAKLKEYREQFGNPPSTAPESPQISAEKWKTMTREEKSNYVRSLRTAQQPKKNSPEQRAAQLKRFQADIDRQVRALQIRQKAGTLTQQESESLERLLALQKRARGRIRSTQARGQTTSPPMAPTVTD